MPAITLVFGLAITALAVIAHYTFDGKSMTMYIPAIFGVPLIIAGLLAFQKGMRKHAMHMAAVVSMLGFLGGLGRGIPKLLSDKPAEPGNNSAIMVWAMTILCGVFLAICIQSFIAARRARRQASQTP